MQGVKWVALALLASSIAQINAQLSKAVASDDAPEDNKFLSRKADLDLADHSATIEHEQRRDACQYNLELKWMTEVTSSVYATPLITDLYSDGRKDVIVPSFVHYLEVLGGPDGSQAVGWPAFHKSTMHASPLLYDIDFDGIRDVLLATYDGEIVFVKDTGEILPERISLPRLRVRRDWYVGLSSDPLDHSHPDVGDEDRNATRAQGMHGPLAPPPPGQRLRHKQQHLQHKQQQQQKEQMQQTDQKQQQGKGAGSKSDAPGGDKSKGSLSFTPSPGPSLTQAPLVPVPFDKDVPAGLRDRVLKFVLQIREYEATYGKEAAEKLLTEAQAANPRFHTLVMKVMQPQGPVLPYPPRNMTASSVDASKADAALVDAVKGASDSRSGSGGGNAHVGARRRLMAAEDADSHGANKAADGNAGGADSESTGDRSAGGAGVSGDVVLGNAASEVGVEMDPKHRISDEAADSFKVFEENEGLLFEEDGEQAPITLEAAQRAAQEDAAAEEEAERNREAADSRDLDSSDGHDADAADSADLTDADAGLELNEDGDVAGEVAASHEQDKLEDYAAVDSLFTKFEYDEFGDRVRVAEGGHEDGEGGQAAGDDVSAGGAEHELDKDHYEHLYMGDYAGMHSDRARWQDESFTQYSHRASSGTHVEVDAHVICTPAIGDLDGDGHDELVVAASHFFDREYYDDPEHAKDIKGLDLGKYVAAAVIVYDLRTRTQKWMQHLDLSTDETAFKAYAYSSPTLADVNGDGRLEIILGGSLGFLYVLDYKGDPLPGWPIQMGEIQAQPLVADLNNDGKLEIFASDTRGNVAAWRADGSEMWERHVRSLVAHGALAADVNGDGELEVIFGTGSGHIYALRGANGLDIEHFPFRTHGRIQSPPMATQLQPAFKRSGKAAAAPTGLQVVMTSFDGFLYAVDGVTGCADTVDIGETSYTAVLTDDLDNDGQLELLVTTMNGNVYSFATSAPYHPLKTWTSQVLGSNGQVARYNYAGVYVTPASRAARDVAGDKVAVQVTVQDRRSVFLPNGTLAAAHLGPYNVSVVLKGVGVPEMGAGDAPVIGVSDSLSAPGTYVLEVPCPRNRTTATIHVELQDKQGIVYSDEYALSFHMSFHRLLKWFVALPLAAMAAALLALTRPEEEDDRGARALPTHMDSHMG